ncbi:unnamed protein product [Boreogadus saida]
MKLQNGQLVHCEDRGSGAQRALGALGVMTRAEPGPQTGAPGGAEPAEPSPAELVQCQEDMGSLLSSIAELNVKIGRLKAPSEPEDFKPSRVSQPVLQGLWHHRLLTGGQERHPAPGSDRGPPIREGRRELWPKLQKALTAVERSVNTRRKWAILTTATDLVRQTEHLVAAETITASATQILEEIQRELGISFPPAMPHIERPQCRIHSSFGAETQAPPSPIPLMGEMGSLRRKLEGLQKAWSSRSPSPLYSPPGASPCGPRSPRLTSPPPHPGSPLLLRRPLRAFTAPLSTLRDTSPPGSPRPARAPGVRSASPAPNSASSHESETERLQRYVERLRARNQRLSSALERTAEPPQGDRPTLQMALAYCQECEEAYSELLSLYELNKQQGVELCQSPSSGPAGDLQQSSSPPQRFRFPEAHQLSTSFSTAGGAVGGDGWTLAEQRAASVGREAALRLHIQGLTAARPLRSGGERPLAPAPGLAPDPGPATYGLEPQEDERARGTEKSLPFEEPFTVGEETVSSDLCSPGQEEMVSSDLCSPGQEEMVSSDLCSPGQEETVSSDLCSPGQEETVSSDLCSPGQEEMVPSDLCSPGQEEMVPSDLCSPGQEEMVSSDLCSPGQEEMVPSDLCSPGQEEMVSSDLCSPGQEEMVSSDLCSPGQEEMAERSAETHLAEEELRCLDWALQALKAQDSPLCPPLAPHPQSPGVGLLHRAEPQSLPEAEANGNTSRSQKKDNLEELHVIFQRDQGLKKRLSLVRESLATALRDSAPRRRGSDDPTSRRAAGAPRSSRRRHQEQQVWRHQEQVWRLEQKVAAMSQSHQSQIAGLKATLEALEGRREETAL